MIELTKSDSNEFLNLTDATNAMERLITSDKVDFIVGGFRTEAVLAMPDVAMDNKKSLWAPAPPSGSSACGVCSKVYHTLRYFFRSLRSQLQLSGFQDEFRPHGVCRGNY